MRAAGLGAKLDAGRAAGALDDATRALSLASVVMKRLTVNEDVASRRVTESFMGATDLADVILVERGIDAERIDAVGRGATQSIADNETEDGRARNRRIEMRLFSGAGELVAGPEALEAAAD